MSHSLTHEPKRYRSKFTGSGWERKVSEFQMLKQDCVLEHLLEAEETLKGLASDPALSLTKSQWAYLEFAIAKLGKLTG